MDFKGTDRELIIQHEVELKVLSRGVDDLRVALNGGFKRISDKLDSNMESMRVIHKTFMPQKSIFWMVTLIVSAIISLGIYSSSLSNDIFVNRHNIKELKDCIKKQVVPIYIK